MAAFYTPIEIIVAEDHPVFREGIKKIINEVPEFKLVGEAANGLQLIDLSRKLKPDIIITDIIMPKMDGIVATKTLTNELPSIGIIGLSMFNEENVIVNMLVAGAKGYLLKTADAAEIITAVKTIYKNQTYYSSEIKTCITTMIANGNYKCYKTNIKTEFSEKEIAIIKLICKEQSSKQIANDLHISKKAVDGLRDNILKKIAAKNTAGIVMYAVKNSIC